MVSSYTMIKMNNKGRRKYSIETMKEKDQFYGDNESENSLRKK